MKCFIMLCVMVTSLYADFQELKLRVCEQLRGSWCSEEKVHLLMDLVEREQPENCVEIGAFTGSSILPVAVALKYVGRGHVTAIDAWSKKIATKHLERNDSNRAWWARVDMKGAKKACQQLLKKWSLDNCTLIAQTSRKAAKNISDIDFLHLDGDYSERGAAEDVKLYVPKVKQGGYILISNLFITVNNKQPKLKSFFTLLDSCEMVAGIEHDNAILLRKL